MKKLKKLICIFLILCFLPIPVKADTPTRWDRTKEELRDQEIGSGIVWTVALVFAASQFYKANKASVRSAKIKAGKAKNIAKYNKEKKLKDKEMKILEEKIIQMIEASKNSGASTP